MSRLLKVAEFALATLAAFEITPAHAQNRSENRRPPFDIKRRLPDLIVEKIKEDDDDIKVKIKNIGTAESSPSQLRVVVTFGRAFRTFNADIPGLRPGEDRTIKVKTMDFRADRKGTRILAIADVTNVMNELNEQNNRLEKLVD
jgi:hypothetical protein